MLVRWLTFLVLFAVAVHGDGRRQQCVRFSQGDQTRGAFRMRRLIDDIKFPQVFCLPTSSLCGHRPQGIARSVMSYLKLSKRPDQSLPQSHSLLKKPVPDVSHRHINAKNAFLGDKKRSMMAGELH
ncbi:hypothetical protein QR680_019014 [Steinernema hermaphroditum]|uniref:Secreted protein n=1 Tax=Steinernema hermaphroditum TaxID=289476 RepID=A0AA39HL19_9BILA|nr:hypothetical protein QR680_019014 [Steinernema hermaphroditum]